MSNMYLNCTRTDRSLSVPCIGIGHVVRVYIKGAVFQKAVKALGTTKGSPLYFQGTVKECVSGAVILKGHFSVKRIRGGHARPQECCRRFEMTDVDKIEVVSRIGT